MTNREKPTNCGTCGTTTTEPTCPNCRAVLALPADPFAAGATPIPPTINRDVPVPTPATMTGRGPVTGRPAGSETLPGKLSVPIKEIAGGVALLAFLVIIGIGLYPRIFGGFSNLPAINDFTAGTCFVIEGPGTFNDTPCSVAHDGEVVGAADWTGDKDYPGATELENWANAACIEQFTQFVGTSPDTSKLDLGVLYPSPSSWKEGDRRAICAVQFADAPESGSVAGSSR